MKKRFADKACVRCQQDFTPTGCNQKRCTKCSSEHTKEYNAELHQQTYVRRGYNQRGEANNNWQGGIGIYRSIKKTDYCRRCGSKKYLLIHHKDHDRYNNALSNLICLCKACHQEEHVARDEQGRFSGSRKV